MLIRFIDRESTKRNERGCRLSNGATLNEGGGGGGGRGIQRPPLIVFVSRASATNSLLLLLFGRRRADKVPSSRMKRMERTGPTIPHLPPPWGATTLSERC